MVVFDQKETNTIEIYTLCPLRRCIGYPIGHNHRVGIIESVDSISRDELDAPLTQYITNT